MKLSRYIVLLLAGVLVLAAMATPVLADSPDSSTAFSSGEYSWVKWVIFLMLGGLGRGVVGSTASGKSAADQRKDGSHAER